MTQTYAVMIFKLTAYRHKSRRLSTGWSEKDITCSRHLPILKLFDAHWNT